MQLVYESRNNSVHHLYVYKLDKDTYWITSRSKVISILVDYGMYTDLFYDPRFKIRVLAVADNKYSLQIYNSDNKSLSTIENYIIKELVSDTIMQLAGIRSLQLKNTRSFDLNKFPDIKSVVDLRRFNCFLAYERTVSYDLKTEMYIIQAKKIVKNKVVNSSIYAGGLFILAGKWFESLKPIAIRNHIYESYLNFEDKVIKYSYITNIMFLNDQKLG